MSSPPAACTTTRTGSAAATAATPYWRFPITDFELSVRSRNCLKKMNIRSLGDLLKTTEQELLSYKNFGETSLNEIKALLDAKGSAAWPELGR